MIFSEDNSYLAIAKNELQYIGATFGVGYYNHIVSGCQQVVEKLLKHIIQEYDLAVDETIFKVHSLKNLLQCVKKKFPAFNMNKLEAGWLTDFYFDTRYPGPDYSLAPLADAEDAYEIAVRVLAETEKLIREEEESSGNDTDREANSPVGGE